MAVLTFRPTTSADVAALREGPLPVRIRAVTALLDGEPIAFGGLAYQPSGAVVAFVHRAERLRRFPKAMHRAALQGLEEARARGIRRIVATADPNVEAAERWLLRLGFIPVDQLGEKVFLACS